MYCFPPPFRNGLRDFDDVINLRNANSRTLLSEIRSDIAKAYDNYAEHSGNGLLLTPINFTKEFREELEGNFRSLDKNRSHHFLRDEILASARLGYCLYCNARTVVSLDHMLPRTVYPEFTILAQNLIPSCDTCNRKKGQVCHWSQNKNLAHLYFVHIPREPILFTDVIVDTRAVTLNFYLRQNESFDDEQFESLENLFKLLGLGDLYQTISIGELSDRWEQMDSSHQGGGSNELRNYLHREATSSRRSRGENYWRTALLWAVAESTDFCDRGYKLLGNPS